MKKQLITVNGQNATSATWIRGGETLRLQIPEEIKTFKKLDLTLNILYEDDHLALIHKPAGILVSGNSFKTIANALQHNIQESSLHDACTPQPIHRLDYGTTGILLIGKTSSSIRSLNSKFENKTIVKTYYAVTIGKMNLKGRISTAVDTKTAQTDYEVLESVTSEKYGVLNLVKLNPKTGRRHQLRKHLSSIGHPILGDKDYGIDGLILKGKGIYLHAHALGFTHPSNEGYVCFVDSLPQKFKKLFNAAESL